MVVEQPCDGTRNRPANGRDRFKPCTPLVIMYLIRSGAIMVSFVLAFVAALVILSW